MNKSFFNYFEGKNILFFFAHPDDETLAAGATLRKINSLNCNTYIAIPNTGIKDRGFMNSIYFKDPLGLLIELASYKFDPPFGFSHADVLEKAHKLRLDRMGTNIEDQDIALAIRILKST